MTTHQSSSSLLLLLLLLLLWHSVQSVCSIVINDSLFLKKHESPPLQKQ